MISWRRRVMLIASLAIGVVAVAHADAITEWNTKACEVACTTKIGPPAYRIMACVQTAAYEAVNAITQKYPRDAMSPDAAGDASLEAAIAAVNFTMLSEMLPSAHEAIDLYYHDALAAIPDDSAKIKGIALGQQAATLVSKMRHGDGSEAAEQYRPITAPGQYVPTTIPAVSQWPGRKPWVMTNADQFRPGPPPALTSDTWTNDYNEIKAAGATQSSTRTAEQTAVAHFWEATLPPIYFGLLQSVTNTPGRDITRNARLLALASQAIDDALIAVMDAKYHYNFWRPITAIRNGDTDGNDATERDASWRPYIETPMHPEYPCAHCAIASAVAAVIEADIGNAPMPALHTTSPSAPGIQRSWTSLDNFIREVEDARVYDGVHFRNSTRVGSALGKQVGTLVATKGLPPETP